jgi:benzoylformate decarboxylase
MNVRQSVMAFFKAKGVDRIFGNPGSTELPMFKDLPPEIDYVLALQEATAVGMADGFAQAGDRIAVVSLHSAAGVGNAMGNIYTAYKNKAPVLIIAGQQARPILPFAPFLFSDDPELLPRPYVKSSVQPSCAEDVPNAVAKAYQIAMQHPRGPVLVSVPVDDWDKACEPINIESGCDVLLDSQGASSAILDALDSCASPVLVVGPGVAQDWDQIISLAETLSMPVWVSPFSHRCAFPESHPLFAGFLPAMREGIVSRLADHDLILVFGAPVFTYHIDGEGPFIREGSKLIQVVNDEALTKQACVGDSYVADLGGVLTSLITSELLRPIGMGRGRASPQEIDPAEGLTARVLMDALARLRPKNSILVEESPSTRATMHEYLPVSIKDGFYTCASGGLGYSLPAAAGVAMAKPETPILALLGDGSSLYSIQALWNMVQAQLPIVVVIVNNGHYLALREFSKHFGMDRLVGTELPGIDFIAQAKAYGMDAISVSVRDQLDECLKSAFVAKKPVLIDVHVATS